MTFSPPGLRESSRRQSCNYSPLLFPLRPRGSATASGISPENQKTKGEVSSTPPLILREAGIRTFRFLSPLPASTANIYGGPDMRVPRTLSLFYTDKACTWGPSNPGMSVYPSS